MRAQLCCLLLLLVDCQERITGDVSFISPYIKHYEGLSYDREDLHKKHLRARRDAPSQRHTLDLDFTAFHRTFRLRLRRDAGTFSSDFEVVSERGATAADLSHLYSGTLEGEHDSACHGSVLRGQFEGSIHADNVIYHVEAARRYNVSDHHSIIYREDDMVLPTRGNGLDSGFCGAGYLKTLAQSLKPVDQIISSHWTLWNGLSRCFFQRRVQLASLSPQVLDVTLALGVPQEAAANRARRTLDEAKTCCLLHLTADHRYFNKFGSVEAVVAQVMTKENISDPLTPLYIGPEKLLSLYSENNWGNFCLSYLLTNRDYSGVLGLAWEGKAGNWGGICSRYTTLSNGRHSTLNTGLVTIQNYGQFLPPRHVQLTLAHELGHSLGAPHDEGSNCGSLGSSGGNGRYLMFPEATDKVRENNDKLSTCSVERINKLLRLKKDDCFVVSDTPICGNQIVEEGEECDVGLNYTDLCCYSTKERVGVQCRLKPSKVCSPSQGLCCSQECSFKSELQTCDEETDCQKESNCSGHSALCPDPSPKENLTLCSQGTRVCFNGVCAESLCVKHNLEQCDCPGDSKKHKCHMCCQQPGEPDTCASTTSSVLSRHFQKKALPLVSGSPCMGNQGYCDKFHVCRLLDADGPIARLKNSFLNLDEYEDLGEWMKAHWWAILLGILALSTVMSCTVCLCGQTLDTRNLD
ncbi:disintegrin and metalloproteinase domain-containing protein 10 isoform 2-T2 [Syngnathus typhle]